MRKLIKLITMITILNAGTIYGLETTEIIDPDGGVWKKEGSRYHISISCTKTSPDDYRISNVSYRKVCSFFTGLIPYCFLGNSRTARIATLPKLASAVTKVCGRGDGYDESGIDNIKFTTDTAGCSISATATIYCSREPLLLLP